MPSTTRMRSFVSRPRMRRQVIWSRTICPALLVIAAVTAFSRGERDYTPLPPDGRFEGRRLVFCEAAPA